MKALHAFLLLASVIFAATVTADEWEPLNTILEKAIKEEVWPGCTAAVFTKDKVLFKSARGHFTYGIPPPENPDENPAVVDTVKQTNQIKSKPLITFVLFLFLFFFAYLSYM